MTFQLVVMLKDGISTGGGAPTMAFQQVREVMGNDASMMAFPLAGEVVDNAPTIALQLAGEVGGNNAPMKGFQLDSVGNVVLEKVGHVHAPENCVLVPSGMFQWPS